MSDAEFAGQLRRAIGYGVVVTLLLGSAFLVFNLTIDSVISTVETVVVPCQHGGIWDGRKCECVGPWTGPMCGECACANGQCDQLHVSAPFANSLWGCRCPDNWLGAYCDLCTSEQDEEGNCNGKCKPGYTGSKCETMCVSEADFPTVAANAADDYTAEVDLWLAGGTLNACSGHGTCDNSTNACVCDDFYFDSTDGKSKCKRTCRRHPQTGASCYGHGVCSESNNIVRCACEEGYHLKSDCSLPCPGMELPWMRQSCSNRGTCVLSGDEAVCECTNSIYLGAACEYKCPTNENGDANVACNGHGTCALSDGPPVRPTCSCSDGWKGNSCQCNDAQTCSGHGVCTDSGSCECDAFFTGSRCNTCVERRFGSQCLLQCDERKSTDENTPEDDIGCNSRGVCIVKDFARASESVLCACSRNFDSETHCKQCKRFYYPKVGHSGLADADDDAAVACQAFANRATCNQAGEPKLGFSSDASPGPPCDCDQANVDGNSFCTKCKETFFPDGGDMSSPSACSKRCVDSDEHPSWMPNVFTLVCKNQGVCDPTGELCICPDGYSGKDCGIACGGETPCSGHGQCVSNKLEQFLSAEVKNSVGGGASHHCQCDPQPPLSDEESLKVFQGLEDIGGDNVRNTLEYMGDFCQYSCLRPGWLDSQVCNGEKCSALPILDNQGSPVLSGCTQDTDCGDWDSQLGRLVFRDDNGAEMDTLTPEQAELRGQLSLQNRWSPRMGPFCKVPTLPLALHTPNMKCTQRVNVDGRTEATEALCESKTTKTACLSENGNCKWSDVCLEALDAFDEYSYCYELMQYERPSSLRSENCTASCDNAQLATLDWAEICNHYAARTPDQFAACSNNLDDLCANGDATLNVQKCAKLLPETAAPDHTLNPTDTAALCWETSRGDAAHAPISNPFAFEPLLDTTEGRELQAQFGEFFLNMAVKHECASNSQAYDVPASCASMRAVTSTMLFDTPAPSLYSCEVDGEAILGPTDLAGNNIFCSVRTTVKDIDPFVLSCPSNQKSTQYMTLLEAHLASLENDCYLVPKSQLHGSSVYVSEEDAAAVCGQVLASERPDMCKRVCGDDVCVNVGTSHLGVHIFQCEREDPSTVSPESCLLGTFSLTGGEGGGEYRCAVSEADLSATTPSTFGPCKQTLVLHADALSPSFSETSGIDGSRTAVEGVLRASAPTTATLVEFDVQLSSLNRGAVNVLGVNGEGAQTVLTSLLLRYFGGLGWSMNAKDDSEISCPIGEGDSCKTIVNANTWFHTIVEFNSTHATMAFGGDTKTVEGNVFANGQQFDGIEVTGSAVVKNLIVLRGDNAIACSRLYRKTGRAATWRQSLAPHSATTVTTLDYCATMEEVWSPNMCTDGSVAAAEVVFELPWEAYCQYNDYTANLVQSTGNNCRSDTVSRSNVVECNAILSKFSTLECAQSAMNFDWEDEYCKPLRNDISPTLLTDIGCDSECLSELDRFNLAEFCENRVDYWDGAKARPRFPSGCESTESANSAWKAQDWNAWCMKKASNTAEGVCSAATCDCSSDGGFLGGDACELACRLGSDGSVCNQNSFSGVCDYPEILDTKVDAWYANETELILNRRASEFQGECRCANSKALAKDGCDVSCDSEDGEPVCNNRTYVEDGNTWQISACHAGGTGVCACLPPMTRQITENVSDWRGNRASVLKFQYGAPSSSTDSFESIFRVRAAQGAESLMINLFNYTESTWRTARQKFETEPALFSCGGRECDFSDVVLAQSLYTTSPFYGPECSRRCPSVDTGETLEPLEHDCRPDDNLLVGADRLTLLACKEECLDNWRCNIIRFNNQTSDCRMFEKCVENNAPQTPDLNVFWYQRQKTGDESLTPCSGRGACGITGKCVCDSAKFLSLTNPITGTRMRVRADERSSLAEVVVTSLDTSGFRGDDCSLVCPGFDPEVSDMSQTCSGHGICTRSAVCQCSPGYTGQNCEYPCPSLESEEDTTTTCSGHGTCSEARVSPAESSVEVEDLQKQYVLTDAWRRWINECKENEETVRYLILPFGEYPGTVNQSTVKGGAQCELVPQQLVDDVTKKFVERPVVDMKAIRDFIVFDSERDLDGETMFQVDGRSADTDHEREGSFRRRYWKDNGVWKEQSIFVSGFELVQVEDGNQYEKFPGFHCDGEQIGTRYTGVETVGECAVKCEDSAECICFDYQENYHSAFFGGCRLAKAGPLHAYPIHSALRISAEDGLMVKHPEGEPTAFEEFENKYVVLQDSKSCRAPTVVIGENVLSLNDCAAICADRYDDGCVYFTYSAQVLRCSQVKTSTSLCEEGFSTDPSGFFAVAVVNQGATAPVAYDRTGSARLFPPDKERGTVSGKYLARARAQWVLGVAQCSCTKSFGFGHWAGFACHTCDALWGGSSCSKKCPGVLGGKPCFGNGQCLWGSKDGLGKPGTFYDATCLCGDPSAPRASDLSLSGTWSVETFDLHVEAKFTRLSATTEFFENPNNYGFADNTCRSCIENRGGKNCASQCSYCLYGGSCQFTASDSIRVPCLCNSIYYDSENGCAPHGFILDETTIKSDVGSLSARNRARRLEAAPGIDVTTGTFYEDAVYPDTQTSLFPSRRFTMPCPNVHETSWMKDIANMESRACKRLGNCRNTGLKKVIVDGIPPRYFPLSCSELGPDWVSASRELFFTYEEKILLDVADPISSEDFYESNGTYATMYRFDDAFKDFTLDDFVEQCRQTCVFLDLCVGAVVKQVYGTKDAWCYISQQNHIASPSSDLLKAEPNALFTTYQLKREYDFCKVNRPLIQVELRQEQAYCVGDTLGWPKVNGVKTAFPPRLSPGDLGYDEDPAQECANRCVMSYGSEVGGIYTRKGGSYNHQCGACRKSCTDVSPGHHIYTAYNVKVNPETWCSLGSVTYGEIELCADMMLDKVNEDATTDSGLHNIDITMGNLGARCEVDTSSADEDAHWESKSGLDCDGVDPSKIRLHDATSVMHDYAPAANALIFGAFKSGDYDASVGKIPGSFGEMRPENPCNGRNNYFWGLNDKTTCKNAETGDVCSIHDWIVCKHKTVKGVQSRTKTIGNWVTSEQVLSDDREDLHSVHNHRAMSPHRVLVNGRDVELVVASSAFEWNIRAVNNDQLEEEIQTLQDERDAAQSSLTDKKSKLELQKAALKTATTNLNNAKYALKNTENSYPRRTKSCSSVPVYKWIWFVRVTVGYTSVCTWTDNGEHAMVTAAKQVVTAAVKSRDDIETAIDDLKKDIKDLEKRIPPMDTAISNKNKELTSSIDTRSCSVEEPCDMCQGNCESSDECRPGLICHRKDPLTPQQKYYSCNDNTQPVSDSYCVHDILQFSNPYEVFVAGYVAEEGVFASHIIGVDPVTRNIALTIAETYNVISDVENMPDTSVDIRLKRAGAQLGIDAPDRVLGYVYATGVTGSVTRQSHDLLESNEPRGFPANSAEECRQLCEDTPGCTIASYEPVGTNVHYKCMLHTQAIPADFECEADIDPASKNLTSSVSLPDMCTENPTSGPNSQLGRTGCDSARWSGDEFSSSYCKGTYSAMNPFSSNYNPALDGYRDYYQTCCYWDGHVCRDLNDVNQLIDGAGTVMLKKPEACNLCKSLGMKTVLSEDESAAQVKCARKNKDDEYCEVFPNANSDGLYTWSDKRCSPVRSGFEKMQTSIVRVGESFKLDEMSPYVTIDGHPDIEAYGGCESLCVGDAKCMAWHFRDILSPDRGDDEVRHACELFSYVPPMISTVSERQNVFSGRTRIGTVQRDFSPVTVIMDDGNHAACDCNEDAGSGGYDCGCLETSFAPYTPSVPNDNVWGCSNHGKCGGTGYFCVCDDGYEWAWADAQNGHEAGFTCRECAAGQYKNSDVKECTPCAIGSFQSEKGKSTCTTCPVERPTTFTVGSKSGDACATCPPGRIVTSLADADHTDFVNLNFDASTPLCRVCPVGKYDIGFGGSDHTIKIGQCGAAYPVYHILDTLQECYEQCSADPQYKNFLFGGPQLNSGSPNNRCYCGTSDPETCTLNTAVKWHMYDIAKFNRQGPRECLDCPNGKTTSTYGMIECDVETFVGECDEVGKGWEHPEDRDPEILGGARCVLCPMGRFVDFMDDGTSICTSCPAGKSTGLIGGSQCQDCPIGYAAPLQAQIGCDECQAGFFAENVGGTECKECPGGYFVSYDIASSCNACPQGYSSEPGNAQCNSCNPGKYADEVALPACKLCPQGRYMEEFGHVDNKDEPQSEWPETPRIFGFYGLYSDHTRPCSYCTTGKYNDEEGSTSASACKVCDLGKYTFHFASSSCLACPPGRQSFELSTRPFVAGLGRIGCECKPGHYTQKHELRDETTIFYKDVYGNATYRLEHNEACIACPMGFSSGSMHPNSVDGSDYCFPCPAGKYTAFAGAPCSDCGVGKYSKHTSISFIASPYGEQIYETDDEKHTIRWKQKVCYRRDSFDTPSESVKESLVAFDAQLAGHSSEYPFRKSEAGHQHWTIRRGYCTNMYQYKEDYTGKSVDDCAQACIDIADDGNEYCGFFSFHKPPAGGSGPSYCILDKTYARASDSQSCTISRYNAAVHNNEVGYWSLWSVSEKWYTHFMVDDSNSEAVEAESACENPGDIDCAGAFRSNMNLPYQAGYGYKWQTAWMYRTRINCNMDRDVVNDGVFSTQDETSTATWNTEPTLCSSSTKCATFCRYFRDNENIAHYDHPSWNWFYESERAFPGQSSSRLRNYFESIDHKFESDIWGYSEEYQANTHGSSAHTPQHRWKMTYNPLFFETGDKEYQHGGPGSKLGHRYDHFRKRCECLAFTYNECEQVPSLHMTKYDVGDLFYRALPSGICRQTGSFDISASTVDECERAAVALNKDDYDREPLPSSPLFRIGDYGNRPHCFTATMNDGRETVMFNTNTDANKPEAILVIPERIDVGYRCRWLEAPDGEFGDALTSYPFFLEPNDTLYDSDRVQECANRCNAKGKTHFFTHPTLRCMCAQDDCTDRVEASGYKSYVIHQIKAICKSPGSEIDTYDGTWAQGPGTSQDLYHNFFGESSCLTCQANNYEYQDESGQGECKKCEAGKELQGSTICVDCPAGKFKAGRDGPCQDCVLGQFADTTGNTECKLCPKGKFAFESDNKFGCTDCPVHFYQNQEGSAHTGADSVGCKLCDANAGQYQDETGQTGCKYCQAGQQKSALEDTEKSQNYYWNMLVEESHFKTFNGCTQCAEGKYNSGTMASCQHCVGNNQEFNGYPNEDQSECVLCTAGMYGDAQTPCKYCPEGWYNDNKNGPSYCKECPQGYHDVLNIRCEQCEGVGKFYDSSVVLAMGVVPVYKYEFRGHCRSEDKAKRTKSATLDECAYLCFHDPDCSVFSYYDYGNRFPGILYNDCYFPDAGVDCLSSPERVERSSGKTYTYSIVGPGSSPGTIAPWISQGDNGAWFYSDPENIWSMKPIDLYGTQGQLMCSDCPVGRYQDDPGPHSVDCKACPAGLYSDEEGLDSLSDCKRCPSFTYTDKEGLTACKSCPSGFARTECSLEQDHRGINSHSHSYTGCASARYTGADGGIAWSYCQQSLGTSNSDWWHYILNGHHWYFASCCKFTGGDCIALPDVTPDGTCASCPDGMGSNAGEKCLVCPRGKASVVVENVGVHGNGRACASCSPGKYQDKMKQLDCKNCPDGYYQDAAGSTACKIAPAGFYTDAENGFERSSVSLCPKGTYQDEEGGSHLDSCKRCPAGYESLEDGSLSCTRCDVGKVSTVSRDCADCAAGTYQNTVGGVWQGAVLLDHFELEAGNYHCLDSALNSAMVSSIQICQDRCMALDTCNFISYSESSGHCMTHASCEDRKYSLYSVYERVVRDGRIVASHYSYVAHTLDQCSNFCLEKHREDPAYDSMAYTDTDGLATNKCFCQKTHGGRLTAVYSNTKGKGFKNYDITDGKFSTVAASRFVQGCVPQTYTHEGNNVWNGDGGNEGAGLMESRLDSTNVGSAEALVCERKRFPFLGDDEIGLNHELVADKAACTDEVQLPLRTPLRYDYYLIESGTCETSGGEHIFHKSECRAAARAVNVMGDSNYDYYVYQQQPRSDRPPGCYWYTPSRHLHRILPFCQVNIIGATQSSNYNSVNWPASWAIDGDDSTFSHTSYASNSWLEVQLEPGHRSIAYVDITNRLSSPSSAQKLDGFLISWQKVGETNWHQCGGPYSHAEMSTKTFACNVEANTDIGAVRIFNPHDAVMITEVKVFTEACKLRYKIETKGPCDQHITTGSECEQAAITLGLTDTTVYTNSWSSWPRGCFRNQQGDLFLNTNTGSTVDCQAGDCICKTYIQPRPVQSQLNMISSTRKALCKKTYDMPGQCSQLCGASENVENVEATHFFTQTTSTGKLSCHCGTDECASSAAAPQRYWEEKEGLCEEAVYNPCPSTYPVLRQYLDSQLYWCYTAQCGDVVHTYRFLSSGLYCKSGKILSDTTYRDGKGPMQGDEPLYDLLSDPDPAQECVNRCKYAHPTLYNGFYLDSSNGCFCAPSCLRQTDRVSAHSGWRAYTIWDTCARPASPCRMSGSGLPAPQGGAWGGNQNDCPMDNSWTQRQCKEKCIATAGCVGVSYLKQNQCRLIKKQSPLRYEQAVRTGHKCAEDVNDIRKGNSLGELSIEDCALRCEDAPGFIWRSSSAGCYCTYGTIDGCVTSSSSWTQYAYRSCKATHPIAGESNDDYWEVVRGFCPVHTTTSNVEFNECQQQCFDDPDCDSFGYRHDTKECRIATATCSKSNLVKDAHPWTSYFKRPNQWKSYMLRSTIDAAVDSVVYKIVDPTATPAPSTAKYDVMPSNPDLSFTYSCKLCMPGTYQPSTGSSDCLQCPRGYDTVERWGQTKCDKCIPGRQGATSYWPDAKYYFSTCTECLPGQYQNEEAQFNCKTCPDGYYTTKKGLTACTPAPVGSFSTSQKDNIAHCPAGYYQDELGGHLVSSCKQCSFGSTTNGLSGQSSCALCEPGKHAPGLSENQYGCRTCGVSREGEDAQPNAASLYTDESGAVHCKVCASDSTNKDKTTCTACAAGKIVVEKAMYTSIGHKRCRRPETSPGYALREIYAGTILRIGSTDNQVVDCAALCRNTDIDGQAAVSFLVDYFSYNNHGSGGSDCYCTNYLCSSTGSQISTPANPTFNYKFVNSHTACENDGYCVAGTFKDNGVCKECPSGYSSSNDRLRCFCPPGSSTNNGACTECPNGYVTPSLDSSSCTICPAGKYQFPDKKKTSCKLCSGGRFQDQAGTTACKYCPAGQITDFGNQAKSCVCPTGSAVENGVCTACAEGKYSTELASTSCKSCMAGFFSSGGTQQCKICPTGYYQNEFESTSCVTCGANGCPGDCVRPGQYYKSQGICGTCPAGFRSGETLDYAYEYYGDVGCANYVIPPVPRSEARIVFEEEYRGVQNGFNTFYGDYLQQGYVEDSGRIWAAPLTDTNNILYREDKVEECMLRCTHAAWMSWAPYRADFVDQLRTYLINAVKRAGSSYFMVGHAGSSNNFGPNYCMCASTNEYGENVNLEVTSGSCNTDINRYTRYIGSSVQVKTYKIKINSGRKKGTCFPCGIQGDYQDETGQTECKMCSDGKFTFMEPSTSCKLCPAGWGGPEIFSWYKPFYCTPCGNGEGFYQDEEGKFGRSYDNLPHGCKQCPTGKQSSCPDCASRELAPTTSCSSS